MIGPFDTGYHPHRDQVHSTTKIRSKQSGWSGWNGPISFVKKLKGYLIGRAWIVSKDKKEWKALETMWNVTVIAFLVNEL